MAPQTCSLPPIDVYFFRGLRSYGIPDDVKVVMPSSKQTIFDKPPGMVAVYLEFFDRCGLRFPLTSFFGECLIYYGVSITQLTPNFVKFMVGFEVLCRVADVKPSVTLFRYFFRPYSSPPHCYSIRGRIGPIPKLILDLPECPNWKSKFVFIEEKMFPKGMSWKGTNIAYSEPNLYGKMLDDMHKLLGFGVEWSILLDETVLHLAKMPNVYSDLLSVIDKNGNEVSKLTVDYLHEISMLYGLPEDPVIESRWNLPLMDDDWEKHKCVGKDGKSRKALGADATRSKRAKLSGKSVLDGSPQSDGDVQVDKRRAAVEGLEATIALLEQVRSGYKDYELVAARQGLKAEVEKNLALKEDLKKAKKELEAARKETSCYGQRYREKLEVNLALEGSLEKAKRELEAEKKRSAMALKEGNKARKSAAAAQQEVSNLLSGVRGLYLQCSLGY